jgi:hypothetical protein
MGARSQRPVIATGVPNATCATDGPCGKVPCAKNPAHGKNTVPTLIYRPARCSAEQEQDLLRAVSATVATVGLDWRRREPTVSAKDSSFSTANSNDTDLSSVHLFKAGSSSKKNLEATRAGEAEGRYTLTSERET